MATGSLLVVSTDVVQAPNDKGQVEPMLEKIEALPEELGKVENLLADTGYFSADNVEACEKAGVVPVITMGRQPHCLPLSERFAPAPEAPQEPTPVEAMAHRLKTAAGRALYAPRKQTPEPVFGIIKSVLGFRQFSLRGLDKVSRRMEFGDDGPEFDANVRPRSRLTRAGPRGCPGARWTAIDRGLSRDHWRKRG